jgi:prolyl oligopeptidase PreP (S9A serine peptidase family)
MSALRDAAADAHDKLSLQTTVEALQAHLNLVFVMNTPLTTLRDNYYLNELGVGIFFPNVRGSTGYGKRFVSLDNGPFRREDSVKDMAALIDAVAADPAVDPAKIGLTGGSYGGYM